MYLVCHVPMRMDHNAKPHVDCCSCLPTSSTCQSHGWRAHHPGLIVSSHGTLISTGYAANHTCQGLVMLTHTSANPSNRVCTHSPPPALLLLHDIHCQSLRAGQQILKLCERAPLSHRIAHPVPTDTPQHTTTINPHSTHPIACHKQPASVSTIQHDNSWLQPWHLDRLGHISTPLTRVRHKNLRTS